jgi:hypothetical protein
MFRKSLKLALVGASVAASVVVVTATGVSAAGGVATLTASSGTAATPFNIQLPAGAACSGAGSSGYLVESFIMSSSIDVSTVLFPDGPAPVAGKFTSSLTSTTGEVVTAKFAGGVPLGIISGIPQLNFNSLVGSGITAGTYKVGIACVRNTLAGAVDGNNYWEKLITVTDASTMAWVAGSVAPTPVLGALTAGDTTLTGTFTAATADPAATYVVTTVPATVSTTVTPGTPFTLTGLTNLTAYTVKVTATNAVGSVDSNTQTGTPRRPAFAAPGSFVGTSAAEAVVLTWAAPVGDSGRSGFTITSPTAPGSPFSVAAGATTLTVTGLTANSLYDFTITANYTDPQSSGTPATVTGVKALANLQIIQDINVTRPSGALVLTQKCGVYGELPAETGYNGGFGPLDLAPAVASVSGLTNMPTNETSARFNQYPYPVDANGSAVGQATYPTRCTINLSTAKLVTTGDRAGQYFTSIGRINQVTVVDTRDSDSAWNIGGIMSDFTKTTGSGSFSGNYMGWTPKMTDDSDATLAGYDQTVIQGDPVAPVVGLGTGLKDGKSLGSAVATKGLGIATLDARLKLLIPLTATDGTYAATLTFTSI